MPIACSPKEKSAPVITPDLGVLNTLGLNPAPVELTEQHAPNTEVDPPGPANNDGVRIRFRQRQGRLFQDAPFEGETYANLRSRNPIGRRLLRVYQAFAP